MVFVDDDVEAVAERRLRVGYLHVPLILSHDSDTPTGAWVQLVVIALAEFLGMTLWFSATAVTPALSRELQLSAAEASWLTMAVQGGFVTGTLIAAFVNIADLVQGRHLVCAGAVGGALANAAVLVAPGAGSAIGLRFLTGVALAAVYPPAMKMAASWFVSRRGLALGLLIGALTLGKAVPYLMTTVFGDRWQLPLLVASGLALAGGVLALAVARDGPYLLPSRRFDPQAITRLLRIRGVRLAIAGYLGHMWELYAMWTWVGVFATASFAAAGLGPSAATAGSAAAFLAIGSGAAGCATAGWIADRVGKARVAGWALVTSATCAALTFAVFGTRPLWVFAGDALGLRRGRRLRAVLGARQRARAIRSSRNGPHFPDLAGLPADDGDDRCAAARWRSLGLAVRVAAAGAGTDSGRDRDEDAGPQHVSSKFKVQSSKRSSKLASQLSEL
jgi:MFS family permease